MIGVDVTVNINDINKLNNNNKIKNVSISNNNIYHSIPNINNNNSSVKGSYYENIEPVIQNSYMCPYCKGGNNIHDIPSSTPSQKKKPKSFIYDWRNEHITESDLDDLSDIIDLVVNRPMIPRFYGIYLDNGYVAFTTLCLTASPFIFKLFQDSN